MKTKSTSFINFNFKSVLIFIVFLVLSLNTQAQYCTATNGCYMYISRVQFTDIDNWSSCSNYNDYTTTNTASIKQGYPYQITVTNSEHYTFNYCDVWVDWNKDSIFDNTSEYYGLSNSTNPYTGIITVPLNSTIGETRMRIRLRYDGNVTPCGDAASPLYGEVEDYTVNVLAASQMNLVSIMFNQIQGIAIPGTQDVKMSCIKVVTDGSLNPLYLKNITLNSLGSFSYISDAKLFYTNNSPVFSMQTSVGNQISSPGNQLLFTDSVSLLPDTNYFWLTYSVSNNTSIGTHLKANLESININDSLQLPTSIDTSAFIEIVAPLNGTYLINAQGNGDYLNFNEAVNDLIIKGVSGAVVFNADSGIYNEQIRIPSIIGVSATNTITFKSTNNDNSSVNLIHTHTNPQNNYTVLLENTSFVNFENLTITSGYSNDYGKVIDITGLTHHINFSDNYIIGSESYYGNSNMALVSLSSFSSSNITILNNFLQNGYYGVFFEGYSSMSDNIISGNTMINQGGYGIYAFRQSNLKISNNYIYTDLFSSYYYGIFCFEERGDLQINANQIIAKNFNNIFGVFLYDCIGNIQNSIIANNFISLQSTLGSANGIVLENDSILQVYYNSISIVGNNSNSNTLKIQKSSNLVFKNNIISNTAFGTAINAEICNQCQSDYNNIYSNGIIGKLNIDDIPDLVSWIAATQVDSNSVSVFPQFYSDTDLHTTNIKLNGKAIPISGITEDIDGQLRNSSTPDIGADEFDPPAYDLKTEAFINLPSGCGLSNNEKIEVIIENAGTSNFIAGNAIIKYSIDFSQQLIAETINRNIVSGDTIHYAFANPASLSVNTLMHDTLFLIKAWVEYGNDSIHANDSIQNISVTKYIPAAPFTSDTIISYATSVSLNTPVIQDYIPAWYESLTSVNKLKIGNQFTTPVLYNPDTLYVTTQKGGLEYGVIGNDNTYILDFPFYSYYSARSQIIYTADQMQAAGFVAGIITSLAFNVYTQSLTAMTGFSINMKNTTLSDLTAFEENGWTNVFSSTYTVPGTGWQEINFQNPFMWDGVSNILINICFDNNDYGSFSYVYGTYQTGKSFFGNINSNSGCGITNGYFQNYQPNIRFNGTKLGSGCESSRSPLHIALNNMPSKDIGIIAILSPSTDFEMSNPVTVGVVVKNYGTSVLDSMIVSYQKNDNAPLVTEMIVSNLAPGDTLHYYFTQTADISTIGIYNFTAFTQLPGDTIPLNDTIHKIVENFTYCAATYNYGCYDAFIDNFVINTLSNNTSGCNSEPGSHIIYPENAFTTVLEKGIPYPFTITTMNLYNSNIGYGIWLDLNHDGDFDDVGEYIYNHYSQGNQLSGNLNIPSIYSYVGNTRLRIRTLRSNYLNSSNSCTNFYEYGETEDYTVTLTPSEPMVIDSILFNQFNGITLLGTQNVKIAKIKIVCDGSLNPLYLKTIDINSLGSSPDINDAKLFYTFNSADFSMQYPFGSQISNPSNQLLFSDSISLLPGTNYFWLTYSVANNAILGSHLKANLESLNINDAIQYPTSIDTLGYIEVVAPLNGTYVINAQGNGNYLSFTEAVNDLVFKGVSGPVIFNVDTGTYNEQINIPLIAGASATNTITFTSTNNDKTSVILNYNQTNTADNYTILLQNTSFIYFQNLTISSGYSYNYSRVIHITGSSSDINISENNIVGSDSYSGNYNSLALIYISPSTATSNISILNNTLYYGSYGVMFDGSYTMNDNTISGNNFLHQGNYGIYVNHQANINISNNYIYSGIYSTFYYGIYSNIGNGKMIISRNTIDVNNFNTIYGISMNYNSGDLLKSRIENNFISLNASSTAIGILMNNNTTIGVYYNSINIYGNNSNTDALNIQNSNGLDIKNNIISNNANGTAFNIGSCNQCYSDYNNIYSNGTFAKKNGIISSDLPLWTSATLMDSNSMSSNPQYTSNNDLHTTNISLNGKAIPIYGITTDIDNQLRNTLTPDIGADEFDLPFNDLELVGFINVSSGCGLSNNEKIEVIVKNVGDSNFVAGNASILFSVDIAQQLVNETINRDIATGDTIHYTFLTGANLSVNSYLQDTSFFIQCWINYTSDFNHLNDSANTSTLSKYLQPAPVVADTIIPYASSVILNAQVLPSYIPIWYDSMSALNSIKIGNPFITPILYQADTLYVSSRKGGLDYTTIGTGTNTQGYPFFTYYHDSRTQILYTADEIIASGLQPGMISSLSFNISNVSSSFQNMNGFKILIQNTSLTNLTGFINSDFTTVYSGNYIVPGTGWKEIVFQNPFYWDGVSNILINICYDNSYYTSNSYVYSTYITNKVWHSYMDGGTGCSLAGGSLQSYRPNIRFKGIKIGVGCESNRVPLNISISNMSSNDIGIISIISPNTGFEISNAETVAVVVKNYGTATIDSMFVSYKKADSTQAVTEKIIRSLASGDTLHYYFIQKINLSTLGSYTIKAFTYLQGDSIYLNDTILKNIENYTYCNATASNGCSNTYINGFMVNYLQNNNSLCNTNTGGYINYPENLYTTTLQKSINYPITIKSVNNFSNVGYGIWLDLNHDGDFDDAGEFLYSKYSDSTQLKGSINISSAYNFTGKTRIRIRAVRYNSIYSYNSCTVFSEYGETEDYTINIMPEPLQKDVQLLSVVKPDSIYQLVPSDVIVRLKNIGLDTLTQIPLTYILNNQTPVSYTWNGQLLPQEFANISLPQLTTSTTNNNFTVFSGLTGDMDNTNDTLFKILLAFPPPSLIQIKPDTINALIPSCIDSITKQFKIYNTGWSNLSYTIGSKGLGLIGDTSILVIQDAAEWGIDMKNFIQTNFNKTATKISYSMLASTNFLMYDIIIVVGNQSTTYYNTISSNKAKFEAFLNNGGIVQYQLASYNGNTINLAGGVNALTGNNETQNKSILMTHPIVNGLPETLNGNDANSGYLSNLPANVKIITQTMNSARPTTIEYAYGSGLVIATTMTWGHLYTNGYNSGPMLTKATNYSISKVGLLPKWISIPSVAGVVLPNDSTEVNITLKAWLLNAGNHKQDIIIKSNDPFTPIVKLPLYLTITGLPQIMLKDSVWNFPSIMAGVISTKSFKIYNTSCDSLRIAALNHTDAAFSTVYPSVVSPYDSSIITVNFSSLIQGVHTDTITILNNSDTKNLYVSGTILPTPQLILTPDSLIVNSSNCNDTINRTILIKNTGNTTMNWNAYFSKGAGKALLFNGSNSNVRIGNLGSIPQKGCVEFWMKANTTSGTKILFSSSGLNNNWKGVNIYQSNSSLYLVIGNDNGTTYTSYTITSNTDYGKWHHVAVSWDLTINQVWTYFDGIVNTNGNYNPYWPSSFSEVRLGNGYNSSSGYYFSGEIDELRIWSENRSAANIKNNFKQAILMPTPALMGLWGFNEASGDTAFSFNNNQKAVLYNTNRVNSAAKIENTGIDVYPSNGVLADGDSINAQVTFVTSGLNSRIHYSGIGISTNDPLHSLVIIPTQLNLTGSPLLQLLTTNLNMNSVMAGASITDSIYFTNIGCDTLKVTNITHGNTVFGVNQTSFTLLPKDTAKLKVSFNPVDVGSYYDTLQIVSNGGLRQLYLHAVAVAAPLASVNPASFNDTITICNQNLTKYFNIKNSGNEILSWNGLMGGIGLTDNFDNGINNSNWVNNSNGASAASCGTAYGNNALYFGGDGLRSITTKSLNTLGGGNISFYIKISGSGGSPCEQADGGEDVVLESSVNNGSSWNIIQTFYVGNYSYFTAIQLAIPISAQNFNTQFRWRQLSHSGSCCDHWSIDEVNINTLNINNITPSSGTIAVGDSATVQLVIDGNGLINGNYQSQLIINTNDPLHLQLLIPIQLIVKANPIISIANNPLIMDTVMISAISSKVLFIKNMGCDSLKITNIMHDLTEVDVNPVSLIILPKDSAAVNVTFSSSSIGNFIDTLKIFNNAGNINVPLKAKTLGAPEIITLPDLITANFTCDSQITTTLKIKNPGIVPLNWYAFIPNQEKGSLLFNGLNNSVSLGNWTPDTKWTVEAWIKPDVLSYGNKLIAGSSNNNTPWGIFIVDKKIATIFKSSQTGMPQSVIADDTISSGVWYHVAGVFNGSTIRLYVNGQLVKSAIANSTYTAYSYPFIGGVPSYSNYFSGNIDEVRIWNKERSQSQISYSMNHILVGNEPGLLGYWTLDKVNGITVADFSGNGHVGTINGASYSSNTSSTLGWVNLSNKSGILNPGDSTQINIQINRHLLPQGTHPFKLIVQSDDPVKPFDTTSITVNAQYNLTPVDIGSDTILCTGNANVVSSGSYLTYNWSNNTYNPNLNVTNSGSYYLTVTDANGCVYSDTIKIGLTQPPFADAGVDKSVCQNFAVLLNGSASGGTPPYQYIWLNQLMNVVSNFANYSFVPANNVMHFLSVIDNNGCQSLVKDTVNITVNPNPIVNAGSDTIINLGSSAYLNASVTGGSYPYTLLWSPANYLSSTNILNPLASPLNSTYYSLTVTDANNCTANNNVYIKVRFTVSGNIQYNNSSHTSIPNAWVYLENSSNGIKDSVLSSGSGDFMFSKVAYASYYLYAKPTAVFGGVNSTDALGIRRHIVSLSSLTGVNLNAADVNNSNTVSSADALQVLRRTVGLITSFSSGDWTSERHNLYYVSQNIENIVVRVLCLGDVNGSYNIYSTKSSEGTPSLQCIPTNKNLIAGESFDLPVSLKQNVKPGAVTLFFQYPEDLIEILAVYSNGTDIEFNSKNGILAIGIYNEKGLIINDNILLSVKCKVKLNAPLDKIGFSILNQSEISDINGKVLNDLQLEMECMNIVDKFDDFILEDNFPNPFDVSTTVRIYIPENSSLRLSIINTLGVEIKSMITEKLSIGWHELQIDGKDLSQGAYTYRIQAIGLKNTFDQTRRMMIIR